VTSGGFGATIGGPVAMGYVETAFADVGTEVSLLVRGKSLPAKVAALPFITPGYKR
jgi:aminomethyltransferase